MLPQRTFAVGCLAPNRTMSRCSTGSDGEIAERERVAGVPEYEIDRPDRLETELGKSAPCSHKFSGPASVVFIRILSRRALLHTPASAPSSMPQAGGDDGKPHGGHTEKRYDQPGSPLPMDILDSLDRISSLELALCSNFTCCSTSLPDLHALVEHFEEKHVVALTIDGKRIYPENTSGKRLAVFPPLPPSLSSSPSSSRSSSPPTPTLPLATAAFLTSNVYTPFSGMMISPPDEDPYGLFDPLDTYLTPSCTPDFPPHAPASCFPSPPSRSHDPTILHPDVIIPDCHFADGGEKKRKRTKKEVVMDREGKKGVHRLWKADNVVLNATAVSAKNAAKTKMRLLNGNNVKKREKAYRCPKIGCTKSYLNPNGLKYHLEKGTCHIQLDVSPSTSEPPTHTPSPSSSSSLTMMHTHASPLPSHKSTYPSTPKPTASSSPYFAKIETYIAAIQKNRQTPLSMMPTPPATPGSESPTCETNLPLPGPLAIAAPSSMISPSPVVLPVPAAPTPISPNSRLMVFEDGGECRVRQMSP